MGGFLIDLDGTIYTPNGLIPGATDFVRWLQVNKKPYVFLSNTGSKTRTAVQTKLSSGKFKTCDGQVPLDNIWTAADSQINMMTDSTRRIPENAYLFVLSGFKDNGKEWLDIMNARNKALVDTWTIKTALSIEEAQDWGRRGARGEIKVFVVVFIDGPLAPTDPIPPNVGSSVSPNYEKDWSFFLMAKVSAILTTGKGSLVYPADDPFNPSDEGHPLPGPGMIAQLFMNHERDEGRMLCVGKGGDLGKKYMMEKAIEMLKEQGHSGDKSKIVMVGDRFDTDIRAGVNVGIKTLLVESGAHHKDQQSTHLTAPATWFASSVLDIVPQNLTVVV